MEQLGRLIYIIEYEFFHNHKHENNIIEVFPVKDVIYRIRKLDYCISDTTIKIVYKYWVNKRLAKGAALCREFQVKLK